MRIRYTSLLQHRRLLAKRVVIVAGLLAIPVTAHLERKAPPEPETAVMTSLRPPRPDPRTTKLRHFLNSLHCPVSYLAEDFVHAADDNQLDWRLLPSISVIESGGGKAYRNNNIFGWDNGLQVFPSIRAGLNMVAFKLGKSPLYRNRDVLGKLHLYNPDSAYSAKVLGVMNRISSLRDPGAAQTGRRVAEPAYFAD